MRSLIVLASLLVPMVAVADEAPPTTRPGDRARLEQLTDTARQAAQRGDCAALPPLGAEVQAIDPEYYLTTFAPDPLVANCTPAATPPSATLAVPPPGQAELPMLEDTADDGSPAIGLGLSLGLTLAGVVTLQVANRVAEAPYGSGQPNQAAMTIGLLLASVGPTTGHIYAGSWWNTGLKVRLTGLAAAIAGGLMVVPCIVGEGASCSDGMTGVGVVLWVGGSIAYLGGTIYEIATAPGAVRRANAARRAGPQLTIAPLLAPHASGLALTGQF